MVKTTPSAGPYTAMPSSPRTNKRNSLLSVFNKSQNGIGTAPNTPDDLDGGGIGAASNGYDPASSLSALAAASSSPPSPMRNTANDDKAVGFVTSSAIPGGHGNRSQEEEKKESDDVVAKTLAYFDHVCAVPKPANRTDPTNGTGTLGIEAPTRFPEWGRVPSDDIADGDETTTNLGSYENSSANPYSYQSTTATSTGPGPYQKGWLSEAPSQDHENFEVVLDPTSLPEEGEQPVPKRRWPFSKRNLSVEKDAYGMEDEPSARRDFANNDDVARQIVQQQLRENDLVEKTYQSDLQLVERQMKRQLQEQLGNSKRSGVQEKSTSKFEEEADHHTPHGSSMNSESGHDQHDEVSAKTKSIMRRFVRKCRKLPSKMSGKNTVRQAEHRSNLSEDAVDDSMTPKSQPAQEDDNQMPEDELLHGSSKAECEPIVEGDEEEADENDKKDGTEEEQAGTMTASASAAWNSLFATLTNTFDDAEEQEPVNESMASSGVLDSSGDATPDVSFEEPVQVKVKTDDPNELPVDDDQKERAWGWKRVKQIRKSAKNLVKPKNSNSSKDCAPIPMETKLAENHESLPATDGATTAPVTQKPKAIWKSVVDPKTGRAYYYHRQTRETTWVKPDVFKQYERDLEAWKAWLETSKSEADVEQTKSLAQALESSTQDSPPQTDKSGAVEQKQEATQPLQESLTNDETGIDKLNESTSSDNVSTPRTKQSDEKKATADTGETARKSTSDNADDSFDAVNIRGKVESRPFDEPLDEDYRGSSRKSMNRVSTPRSPYRNGTRTMTMISKASANTRSSALTDRTEKIKNTGKGKFVSSTHETYSTSTSLSSRDQSRFNQNQSPDRIPSRVPVPRERQLMVEELTDARISAETYAGNGYGRGRIMRGKLREHVVTVDDPIYDGDNDTEVDNTTAAYETDTYGTDSVSALSENDTDFLHRKDNFDLARRRALDDAIEREDWDLAAAISEGMRAANMPGGYEKAHSSWNQSELDKFIANNDWNAVKSYIARMRSANRAPQRPQKSDVISAPRSQNVPVNRTSSSASKNIGASSQLQHKDLMSESSWTSDSQSSYESYDSESEI